MDIKYKVVGAIGAVAIVTNPLTNQYIIQGIEFALIESVIIAPYAAVLFAASVVFLLGGYYATSNKVKTKGSKKKNPKSAMKYEDKSVNKGE